MNRSLTLTAAALAVMALGFAAGWTLNISRPARASGKTAPSAAAGNGSAEQALKSSAPETSAAADSEIFATRLSALAGAANPHKRARMIGGIADDLNAAKVREALAATEKLALRERDEVRLQLLSRWAELEPEAALQYAQQLPGGSIAPGAIQAVIKSWAATDLRAAEEAVEKMTVDFPKQIALKAFLETLAETDPQQAFAITLSKTPLFGAEQVVIEQWAQRDPAAAAAHAILLPPGRLRDMALSSAGRRFAEADLEGALAWAQSLPTSHVPGATIQRRDPAPLAAVVQTWMEQDADAALQWIEKLPDDFAKAELLGAISRELAGEQPHRAVELTAMMPAGKTQDRALESLMRSWGGKDFTGALAWAQQQDAELRQVLLPQLVDQIAWRDTPAALELAVSIGDKAGQRAVSTVVQAWARKEPVAASTWAVAQPDNGPYLASVARTWAATDESSARAWVTALPAGEAKDEALFSGVRYIAQTGEPLRAENWIAQLKDEKKHTAAMQELAFWWLRSNPKEARAWISTASLPEKIKRELLKDAK